MNPLVQIFEHKVVAIVRGAALRSLLRIVQALHTGGIRLMAYGLRILVMQVLEQEVFEVIFTGKVPIAADAPDTYSVPYGGHAELLSSAVIALHGGLIPRPLLRKGEGEPRRPAKKAGWQVVERTPSPFSEKGPGDEACVEGDNART